MTIDMSDYDCSPGREGNTACELDSDKSKAWRTFSGCVDGAAGTDTALSMAEPVLNLEPNVNAALRAGGCGVGTYREWSKPEEVVFIGDEESR